MKVTGTKNKLFFRVMNLATALSALLSGQVRHIPVGWLCCLMLFSLCSSALLRPEAHESPFVSCLFSGLLLVFLSCFLPLAEDVWMVIPLQMSILFVYSAIRKIMKYSKVSVLFKTNSVWTDMIDDSHSFYQIMYSLEGAALLVLAEKSTGMWLAVSALLLSYAALCYRSEKAVSLMVSVNTENKILEVMKSAFRILPDENDEEKMRMKKIFDRVIEVMEEKKPYLSDSFSVSDLAKLVFTNRVYVSKIINYYSGLNFNQFVNHFRVDYAETVIRKDPNVKMNLVAMSSGFHSVVTFNTAFKMYKGCTPGQFARNAKSHLY